MKGHNTILKITLGFLMILMLSLGVFFVTGIVSEKNKTSADTNTIKTAIISEEQAKQIASSVANGTMGEVELETVDNKQIYSVEFNLLKDGNEVEYDVHIDAETGKVLKIEREDELTKEELTLVKVKVTEEQAKQIALSTVKGEVTEFEIEKVDGNYVYEVEISQENTETDVRVDVNTGQILSIESGLKNMEDEDDYNEKDENEDQDDDENYNNDKTEDYTSTASSSIKLKSTLPSTTNTANTDAGTTINAPITREQAEQIALAEVGGKVTDFEKKGNAWEIELKVDKQEVDVLVDITTGKILNIEYN